SSAGGTVFPLILGSLIEGGNWRLGMQVMSIMTIFFALIPMLLLVKDRPSKPSFTPKDSDAGESKSVGPSVAQALRETRFYLIAIATGSVWFALIGMQQHQSIYLAKDIGISFDRLPEVFSSFFACAIIGKLLFGWLSDHFDQIKMMVLSIFTLALAMVVLRNVAIAGDITLFGYAIFGGIGFGGAFTMIQLMFANFYSGPSFGKILAILMLVDTLSGAIGIRALAILRESTGSYLLGIDIIIALLVFASCCILIAGHKTKTAL
ncbi:MAG: MFS transporter, partial [Pseudomonadota bacterium]|nr:MFS transporter [Pseudomonadota bacterium]